MSSLLWKPIFLVIFILFYFFSSTFWVRTYEPWHPISYSESSGLLVSGATLHPEDSGYEIETGRILKSRKLEYLINACLQGGGGPQVVKVTSWGGVTSPVHIISYFNLITCVYMIDVDDYHIFLESSTSMTMAKIWLKNANNVPSWQFTPFLNATTRYFL